MVQMKCNRFTSSFSLSNYCSVDLMDLPATLPFAYMSYFIRLSSIIGGFDSEVGSNNVLGILCAIDIHNISSRGVSIHLVSPNCY